MPFKKDVVVIPRAGRTDWRVSQATLDKIVSAIKSGEGMTEFKVAELANVNKQFVNNALRYYPPAMALVNTHMGVSSRPNAELPRWADQNTPIEKQPRKFSDNDFAMGTPIRDIKIADDHKRFRLDAISIAGGARRKPTVVKKSLKHTIDRSHYVASKREKTAITLSRMSRLMDAFQQQNNIKLEGDDE